MANKPALPFPTPPMPPTARFPLILFVTHTPWLVQSFEAVLAPEGFQLVHASPGDEAQRLFPSIRPDVVLIESGVDGDEALDSCRELRSDAPLGRCTPIVLVCTREPSRAGRLAALRCGAWDVMSFPADPEELVLKLRPLAGVRAEVDRVEEQGMLDPSTGFYNARGLVKRAHELAAESQRHGRSVGCVTVAVSPPCEPFQEPGERVREWVSAVAVAIRRVARESDAIGRLRDAEFAILAPCTGWFGARRLAERLEEELRAAAPGGEGRFQIHTGCHAVEDAPGPSEQPVQLVVQAMQSLRKAQMESPLHTTAGPPYAAPLARTLVLG
jgi:DNA-binding response OmpR family regulator